MVIGAGFIAFGSTVTTALIEIGDRLREISTFRVLGYTPGQIAGILFRQTVVTFAVGVILALPLGYAMTRMIASAYNSELYRVPVLVRPGVVVLTIVLAIGFMLAAQGIVYLQIRKLDWLEGVKVKE
jgi:putative ABC transport system permease protein